MLRPTFTVNSALGRDGIPYSDRLLVGSITEPATHGIMDFVVKLSAVKDKLTGTVNSERTQAFPGSPSLNRSITNVTGVITPTFVIISSTFSSINAGRTVTRSFTLEGEILDQGNALRGIYSEHIEGFTRRALNVQGTFLLVRPSSPVENN
jgi:hypothetical protein